MIAIDAPVLLHLAEEVHAIQYPGIEESFSLTPGGHWYTFCHPFGTGSDHLILFF